MAEKITLEQRRRNMQAIRSQSKLENTVSKALWAKGIRFRKNDKTLFGKPDISIKKYKIVIFIDSCFWHVCETHGNWPKNNSEYWNKKLKRNISRDKEVTNYYLENEWNILRIWEHDFKENYEESIENIVTYINEIKKNYKL